MFISKTSSIHVFKTSWRRLQRDNFSSSKMYLQDLFMTSSRRLGRQKIVWRHVLKTSSRRYEDQKMFPGKSQMNYTTTSQWYVSATSYYYDSRTSPVTPKWNTQLRCCGTSPPCLRVTLLWLLVSNMVSTAFLSYFVMTSIR